MIRPPLVGGTTAGINRSGKLALDAGSGTAVAEAHQLVQAAHDLIGKSGAR